MNAFRGLFGNNITIMTNSKSDHHIIRWAGGKNWLQKTIDKYLPKTFNNYHEPFLGGGSIFLHLQPEKESFLSDINDELVNAYIQIRDNLQAVWQELKKHKNTSKYYYDIRNNHLPTKDAKGAARFIYLNRTSFNGIYRVNLNGIYNVPYGHKHYMSLFELDRFRKLSQKLKACHLTAKDFSKSLDNINKGDLVYLDPPYTVSHNTNSFIKYNEGLFQWKNQLKLAEFIKQVIQKDAYYILSNAKHPKVKNLFGKFDKPIILTRHSVIGGKNAERGKIQEYLFFNTNQ